MATAIQTSIQLVTFQITGISALLMHNPVAMQGGGKRPGPEFKKIPTPEEEAERSVYRLPDGQLYQPTVAFRASMVNKGGGASGLRIGKRSAIGIVSAAVSIVEKYDKCPLYHPRTGKPIKEYTIDSRRAVVQGQGIIRSRARIEEWACDVTFEVNTDFCTIDQLLEILNMAGRVAGVGDFRPQCKGWFGKFTAELKKIKLVAVRLGGAGFGVAWSGVVR